MSKPLLRAEGIILNTERTKILVQCDLEETFYRLPGGSIEFGETGADAINRELIEEFDLSLSVGKLICVNENIIEYDGKKVHNCTLIHLCSVNNHFDGPLIHKELQDIQLIWRTIEELNLKDMYPEGILNVINLNENCITHIVIEKEY